jgi:DNA-binding PadR family transcriptional regulator
MTEKEIIENQVLELRRGVTTYALLQILSKEQYGYSLQMMLSQMGLEVEQGTLYPLLRRLEQQGLLDSTWRVEEGRPRRYYQINDAGKEILQKLVDEWARLNAIISEFNQV